MAKDLYSILGVSRDADENVLKKAYRSLAKKYHPDLHPDDAEAEAKFKEINEAFAILSDPEKRRKYDQEQQQKTNTQQHAASSGRGFGKAAKPKTGTVDFSQMQSSFAQFFGFDPATGQVVNEEKLRGQNGQKSNPLDRTDLFNRFMGFK